MTDVDDLVRLAIQCLSLTGYISVIIFLILLRRAKRQFAYQLPTVFWAINGITFYTLIIWSKVVSPIATVMKYSNTWSALLRLHGLIILIIILAFECWEACHSKK